MRSDAGEEALEAALAAIVSGADVNARDAAGRTPLIAACAAGDLAMVDLLLEAGANARLEFEGWNAAEHARGPRTAEILDLLRRQTPERPGLVREAFDDDSSWLASLPGDGQVIAVRGSAEEVATAFSQSLPWRFAGDHAAPFDGGYFLLQPTASDSTGSLWSLLLPFGAIERGATRLVQSSNHEAVELAVWDTSGTLQIRRWQQKRLLEKLSWNPDDGFDFQAERPLPVWLERHRKIERPECLFERYLAELGIEVPHHFVDFDLLDAQLQLSDQVETVGDVLCLSPRPPFELAK